MDIPTLRANILPRAFFARDADVVARDLLGKRLVHETPQGVLVGRVVETEAYFGPPGSRRLARRRRDPTLDHVLAHGDAAAHSYRGPTDRNRVMFGPPAHAYVYLIYGMHECLNVVTGEDGEGQAVLLRAMEPLAGADVMRANRGGRGGIATGSGPAKLVDALGVSRVDYGHDMTTPPLYFARGRRTGEVASGPRVGVVGAEELPLRFWIDGNPHVSRGP